MILRTFNKGLFMTYNMALRLLTKTNYHLKYSITTESIDDNRAMLFIKNLESNKVINDIIDNKELTNLLELIENYNNQLVKNELEEFNKELENYLNS